MKMDKKNTLRWLAFIKHLFLKAENESLQSEPMNAIALLMMHDAVEMFLQLVAEKLNISTKNFKFLDYWKKLTLPKNRQITQKESMRKLNNSRVALKHSGIKPSKQEIESFKNITKIFFEHECKNIFNLNFEDISLVDLVNYENVKDSLARAKNNFKMSDINETLKNFAIAFSLLLHNYEFNKKRGYRKSPFFFGEDFTFLSSNFMRLDGDLGEFIDKTGESIEALGSAVKILSFGINYKKFVKFSYLTPKTYWTIDAKKPKVFSFKGAKISKKEFDFCFNFIIESALVLQEFDFEISAGN